MSVEIFCVSHRKIRPAEPQRFSRHSSATNKKGRSIWNVLFCWWSSRIKIRIPCRRALVKRDRPRSMRIIVGQDRFILEHDEVEGAASFALSSTTTGTTPAADRRLISHIIYVTLYRGKNYTCTTSGCSFILRMDICALHRRSYRSHSSCTVLQWRAK